MGKAIKRPSETEYRKKMENDAYGNLLDFTSIIERDLFSVSELEDYCKSNFLTYMEFASCLTSIWVSATPSALLFTDKEDLEKAR